MSRLAIAFLLLLPWPALAEDVSVSFSPPDPIALFDSAKLLDVKGRGGTCAEAAKDALDTAKTKAGKKGDMVVVGIYPDHPGDVWDTVDTLDCRTGGKNPIVKLTALAVHPGDGFPKVTGAREAEIVGELAHDDPVLPTPVGQIELVQLNGHVFYSLTTGHKETFAPGVIRVERALESLRADIEPNLDHWIPRIADISEITGLRVVVSVSLSEWDDASRAPQGSAASGASTSVAMHGESYEFYIPTRAGAAFVSGKLNERQLTDAMGVFLSPVGQGSRVDLSSRASEKLSGPTVNFAVDNGTLSTSPSLNGPTPGATPK